jgi:hypothetical protein
VTGKPTRAGTVTEAEGSATRGKVDSPLPAPKRSKQEADGEPKESGLLEALKKYRRDNE